MIVKLTGSLKKAWRTACATGRLMVGVHDYDNYVAQTRRHNPHAPVMSKRQFYDYCHKRRLGGSGSRCC
ncbi:MAG: YbdD/YjiX family protein [Neisseria sp.]|nr:YbdD/YjiX family protein [Neisseria sp.]